MGQDTRGVSVIVPVWREDREEFSPRFQEWALYPGVCEVIVSLCGRACAVAESIAGVRTVTVEEPGRGRQMNAGAQQAASPYLLFQHADSRLDAAHIQELISTMSDPQVIGGGFHRHFDERHPHLKWLEPIERWHCERFGTIYGDQSVFVRAEIFHRIGGFPDYPLMEDVAFSKKLRAAGKVALLDPPMASSPRKHLEQGPWKTTLRNLWYLVLFHAGVDPRWMYRHYYGGRQIADDADTPPLAPLKEQQPTKAL